MNNPANGKYMKTQKKKDKEMPRKKKHTHTPMYAKA